MNKHVELLRNPPVTQRWYGPDAIMGQAADEIERLEADNARLNAEIDKACKSQHELRAELAEANRVANHWWVERNRLEGDNARLNTEIDKACKSQNELRAELAEAKAKAKPLPSPALVKAAKELAKTIWPTAIIRQSPTAAAILALCAAMKEELTDGE